MRLLYVEYRFYCIENVCFIPFIFLIEFVKVVKNLMKFCYELFILIGRFQPSRDLNAEAR